MTLPPRFEALTPTALASRLAHRIDGLGPGRVLIGFDGDETVGTGELADLVAQKLVALQRPVARVSTDWWWRAASLRLEFGRHDRESRLTGWVDVGSLGREVMEPLRPGGTGRFVSRLRDRNTDRAVREPYQLAPGNAVLLLDGPLLLTHGFGLDEVIRIGVSAGRLRRALPEDRHWEIAAFDEYAQRWPRPTGEVVVSYDHPDAPAVRGLGHK